MADAETATATAAPPTTETKPPAAEPKRWGDIEDDAPEEPTRVSGSTSEVSLDGLKIDESKKINKFLDEPEDSNIKAVTSGDTPYTSASTFEDLNLSPELLKGLYVEMKFQKPSKIQAISLPMILTPPYKDLIAQAHNGSGKTTCFVLGMLSRVDPKLTAPQALCICPTRELAIQNMEVLRKMGKYTGITSECAVPMDSRDYMPISKRAPISAQIVIGTPGTIKKWMSAKKLGTSYLKILVFDEADHMLAEDGFKDDSLRIKKDIERSSSHCQVLLFSATFNETVKNFVSKIVKSYNQLFVKKEELSLEAVKQYKVYCHDELAKIQIIKERIFDLGENLGQRIIFVRTRNSASMLHKQLTEDGYTVSSIQGAITPEDRDKLINEFRSGLSQVLISTDLLARGFDQQQINLVINYDLPIKYETHEPDYEVYLHRIGRAGRFGRKGAVFNLICGDRDAETIRKIELYFQTEAIEVKNNDEEFENALRQAGLL
ncbi:DEAD-box ATP-dependent RNA helicase 38 [Morus notabilis]|uniref:RNA helicase n=1 Tax=Morus notabilis TaxID=981085 RepID=W9RX56_9ROSA|nr:DEAD-box ATP-dependent RNA helicase 38 [Morus notabilis]EXB75944.1 DEAD-box ATP-dependent RNA helicase 38 [Morus notabilis]